MDDTVSLFRTSSRCLRTSRCASPLSTLSDGSDDRPLDSRELHGRLLDLAASGPRAEPLGFGWVDEQDLFCCSDGAWVDQLEIPLAYSERSAEIAHTQDRAITLGQLNQTVEFSLQVLGRIKLVDQSEYSRTKGERIVPQILNMVSRCAAANAERGGAVPR